jgi:putative ABC transport system permease protein
MSHVRRFLLRLYNVIAPARAERRLQREVESHLAVLEERFHAQGLTAEEARAAARRGFGGVEQAKELQREARSFVWLEDMKRDVVYGIRTMAGRPGFAATAVLTLALGIGAVTIIYSVINNVLFDPLPYPDSHRFVNVFVANRATFPPDEFLDYQEGTTVFEDVVGTMGMGMMYAGPERSEFLRAVWVTPNFFEFMGLPPSIGQTVSAANARPDAAPVAVLRHRAWVNYFGGDPRVIGRTILLNGDPYTVIAVMPPRFTWHAADLWLPKRVDRGIPTDQPGAVRNFQARLKPGVTIQQAEAQLSLVAARRAKTYPDAYPPNFRVQVFNVIEFTVGSFSRVLYIAMAAVLLLLVIACCNVANMLLARATAREREMTIRAALGAGRGRIVRQLLVESVILGLIGVAIGCLFAYVGLDALVAVLPPGPLPGEIDIKVDGASLFVSFAVGLLSAVLFGLAPAWYSARRDLVDGLKGGSQSIASGRSVLRNGLVAMEIALSVVLLLGAGLLMRTFVSLVRVDLGFKPDRILNVPIAFAPGMYSAPGDKHQFYESVLGRLAALPGVEAVAVTNAIPPYGANKHSVEVPGASTPAEPSTLVQLCTQDYFRTLGIRIVRGSGLGRDVPGERSTTAVVNQTFARMYFPSEDPIGKSFRLSPAPTPAPDGPAVFEVAGVVEDVRNQGIRQATAPHVYLSGVTTARGAAPIFVRTIADPARIVGDIRREIAAVDRRVAIREPDSLERWLDGLYAQPRFSLIVMSWFAIVGAALVAIGVFSVMAYTVSRQTKEIAIRMAIGAGRGQVFNVVLRFGLRLLALGLASGLLISLATTRLIANQLWNTSPHDPLTTVAVMALISLVTLGACYVPARRAMTVDPIAALRQD